MRRKFEQDGKLVNTLGEYSAAVRETARLLNVLFVDMQKKTRKFIAELGQTRSMPVYLHFTKGEFVKFSEGKQDDTHLSL